MRCQIKDSTNGCFHNPFVQGPIARNRFAGQE
ncbi:MAG: hypothetical protein RLZZ278_69, partial [Pseudomonadota bacterium]